MKRLTLLLLAAAALAGCDAFSSEPTYGGLSVEGFNYTPYNLDRFVIKDKYGNSASGGGDLVPGAGEGSLSCCYKLKGTDFVVDWYLADQDEFLKNPYGKLQEIHRTTQVHIPPTKVSGGAGDLVLGLHFYPDDHVEPEFRNDLKGTRIFYADIWDQLRKKNNNLLNPDNEEDGVVFRKVARLAAAGWTKYHLTNTQDLEQYVYFTLLNPNFDQHPAVRRIIQDTQGKPGAFGSAMKQLPNSVIEDLKRNHFEQISAGAQHG
ncbi:hypothetical protein PQR36_23070 [Paraburkholderia nemoris]|uniref:hypothetical protein n=1 Tax=Paraburkholderia nemoris TaxID=2793076 RepID=UPI0038BA619A